MPPRREANVLLEREWRDLGDNFAGIVDTKEAIRIPIFGWLMFEGRRRGAFQPGGEQARGEGGFFVSRGKPSCNRNVIDSRKF